MYLHWAELLNRKFYMISLENIYRKYHQDEVETLALQNINLSIKQGEFVAIMGASGCGKSTLLNILGLLDAPDSGSYKFLAKEVSGIPETQKAELRRLNIGFIFQNFNLIDELSVFDNIGLPLVYNRIPKSERKRLCDEIMVKLDIAHRANYKPQQLSGGQQQRVAVARALVTRPKLILADEPTGNLDSTSGNEVMNLLADLHREGSTIVMVTHSAYDAGFASKTVHMKDGQILQEKANSRNTDYFQITATGTS